MSKIVAGFIGNTADIEQDLKADLTKRYYATNSVLIVLEGELLEGSIAERDIADLADGVSYCYANVPDEFPAGKRVIVVHADYADKETKDRITQKGYAETWNDAVRTIAQWKFPKCETVVIYAVCDIAEHLNFSYLHALLNLTDCDDTRLFWSVKGHGYDDTDAMLKKYDAYSDVIAICDKSSLAPLLREAIIKKYGSSYGRFLKNNATVPLFSSDRNKGVLWGYEDCSAFLKTNEEQTG